MSETTESQGAFETRDDAGKGQEGVVKYWLAAIDVASAEEEDWREEAEKAEKIYYGGEKNDTAHARRFNILYSNTQTMAAAAYNSTPVPDVRRRFGEDDPAARVAAQVLERCLSYIQDEYDVDAMYRAVVVDALVAGRGVPRVVYKPVVDDDGTVSAESIYCAPVDWRLFRHGPARHWAQVQWVAFRHFLSREQLVKLNPRVGKTMQLDFATAGANKQEEADGEPLSDVFKRAEVWEIWDKERREVLFVAPSYTVAPLMTTPDPLGLAEFFPCPRPLQGMDRPGSLTPVVPYSTYSGLAEELEKLTKRAYSLIDAIRFRGAYNDAQAGDFLAKFEDLMDGEVAPLDNPQAFGSGLDKTFWFQPTDQAAAVLLRVYEAREQTKQAIYEITGIADLLRGSSVASETATAQSIKAQWGSLRVQVLQAEVQRVARDVMRLKAEVIAEKFQPTTLSLMSGMQMDPQVLELLQTDPLRRYRVDVETDSTIRADLNRQQQNITNFVSGFGQFIQSVGPAVQAGALPMPVVAEMVKSFSRVFKLGRAVEEALDSIPAQAPQQQDPNAAAAEQQQAQQQAEMARMQAQMQMKQMEIDAANQREAAKLAAQQQADAAKMDLEREKMVMDHDLRIAAHNHTVQQADRQAENEGRRFGLDQRIADANALANGGAPLAAEDQPSVYELMSALVQQQNAIAQNVSAHANQTAAMTAEITEALKAVAAPKRIIRDRNNRAVGVEPVPVQ